MIKWLRQFINNLVANCQYLYKYYLANVPIQEIENARSGWAHGTNSRALILLNRNLVSHNDTVTLSGEHREGAGVAGINSFNYVSGVPVDEACLLTTAKNYANQASLLDIGVKIPTQEDLRRESDSYKFDLFTWEDILLEKPTLLKALESTAVSRHCMRFYTKLGGYNLIYKRAAMLGYNLLPSEQKKHEVISWYQENKGKGIFWLNHETITKFLAAYDSVNKPPNDAYSIEDYVYQLPELPLVTRFFQESKICKAWFEAFKKGSLPELRDKDLSKIELMFVSLLFKGTIEHRFIKCLKKLNENFCKIYNEFLDLKKPKALCLERLKLLREPVMPVVLLLNKGLDCIPHEALYATSFIDEWAINHKKFPLVIGKNIRLALTDCKNKEKLQSLIHKLDLPLAVATFEEFQVIGSGCDYFSSGMISQAKYRDNYEMEIILGKIKHEIP